MKRNEILKTVDHTLLAQTAVWDEIRVICDDAIAYGTASVCIPPSFIKKAKEYVGDKMKLCTVIGFPNGYSTSEVKEFETKNALLNGADEIDMVVNLGDVKEGNDDKVIEEIRLLKKACGDKILKVIVETCLLTEEEKILLCGCVTRAGADYIKTSTGFGTKGAQLADVQLFREHIGEKVRIKAAGGIRSVEDMEAFLEAGADRLGTSSAVSIFQSAGLIEG